MGDIANISSVVIQPAPKASVPVLSTHSQAPSLPTIGAKVSSQVSIDADAVENRRWEAMKNAAKNAPQPLGNQTFVMFKDSSGEIITRFRDINSGKLTYIPEPTLFSLSGSRNTGGDSILNIKV